MKLRAPLRCGTALLAVFLAVAPAGAWALGPAGDAQAKPGGPAVPPIDYVNISATSALSFMPASFSVEPGQSLHLVITQLATFEHTFTLSSVVNVTNLWSDSMAQLNAFLYAHPPLVNISLGSVAGAKFYANISAPAVVGIYEYICYVHYTSMTGQMSDAPASSGSGSSGPPISPLLLAGIVVGILIVVGVVWAVRRRRAADERLLGRPPTQGS